MKSILRKRTIKLLSLAASLCLLMSSVLPCYGAERQTYTYTVTFSAGNQGTLSLADGESISVDGGGDYEISLSEDGKTVKITGLTLKNHVRFLNSAVELDSNGKYYVKGVRMGGRDNNTVELSYFPVERDQDYVVAYGIKGKLVPYTINYVDQEGNELYPSQVYYGNIGDRPVVAHLYVEGYQPQAYNLTGTLQSDGSKNIFTFVYRPVVTTVPADPGTDTPGTSGGTGNTPGGTTNTPGGTTTTPGGTATAPGAPNEPGAPGENEPGGNEPGGNEPGENDPGFDQNTPDTPEIPDDQDLPDPSIPEDDGPGEPDDVRDINDEEIPLGSFDNDGTIAAANSERVRNTWIAAGIGILAVLVLAAGLYFYSRMRKSGSGKKQD